MHCAQCGINIAAVDHYCFACGARKLVNYDLRRATTGWEGRGGLPCPILKIRKKCPDFVKNSLIVPIFELNFPINK